MMVVPASRARALLIRVAPTSSLGGRELFSDLIERSLRDVFRTPLLVHRLQANPNHLLARMSGVLMAHVDGINRESISSILSTIREHSPGTVLLDGSNLGSLAKVIATAFPSVRVVSFFHNCEARFFYGALRQHPSVHACGVLLANYLAERSAVRFSNVRICLNERDSRLLRRLYGRGATHISPMAMQDQFPPDASAAPTQDGKPYALFVGGTFYANQQGIEWYADKVAARAPIPAYVVGKGFERWKDRLERNGNVKVIGEVDRLAEWYLGAQFVIAPIFDGSGMKTKVAEALMFGKRIVGTSEAFVGYEKHADQIGVVCRDAEEFLEALDAFSSHPDNGDAAHLRRLYHENYSDEAMRRNLARIFAE